MSKPTEPHNILLVGPTSGIGRALGHRLAQDAKRRGYACNLILAGREGDEIEKTAADLRLRYDCGAVYKHFDATDFDAHSRFFEECTKQFEGGLTGVLLTHGYMAEQADAQRDFAVTRRTIDVNYTSAVSVCELAAAYFEPLKRGFICAVSSVAGDRGRQSNYTYGSAKAALTAYLQGLRNRLFRSGVAVVTVKPGFVDTGMTWGLLKPGSPLVAQPEKVAADITKAIRRRKNAIYTPGFWRMIMFIIRNVPEPVFKRLKL